MSDSKVCWTITEIQQLLELLLENKHKITIRTKPANTTNTSRPWLVEWQPDLELCSGGKHANRN